MAQYKRKRRPVTGAFISFGSEGVNVPGITPVSEQGLLEVNSTCTPAPRLSQPPPVYQDCYKGLTLGLDEGPLGISKNVSQKGGAAPMDLLHRLIAASNSAPSISTHSDAREFLTVCLERDTVEAERVQALKLILVAIRTDPRTLPTSIVSSLIAVAEATEDTMSRVALGALCEQAMANPQSVSSAGGLRLLIHAVLDPQFADMADGLVFCVVLMLNDSDTRRYYRPGTDLELLLSPLTDTYVKSGSNEARWMLSKRALVAMLKTWPGLVCLSDSPLGLGALVSALTLNNPSIKLIVFEILYELFGLGSPACESEKWSEFFYRYCDENRKKEQRVRGDELPARYHGRYNLVDSFRAILLLAFTRVGLIETLVGMGESDDRLSSNRAVLLLGEILHLANTLLPPMECARIQSLPSLVMQAAHFSQRGAASRACTFSVQLEEISRWKAKSSITTTDFHLSLIMSGATRAKGNSNSSGRRPLRVDVHKAKKEILTDDDTVKAMVKDSLVESTKDFQKWNWDVIGELLDGPLDDSVRMAEVLKKTKFIKKITAFLSPASRQFSSLPILPSNERFIRIGCQLVDQLLHFDEGLSFLRDDELFQQIAEILHIEAEPNPDANPGRILSPDKIRLSLCREYITLIGTASASRRGLILLNETKIFNRILPLTQQKAAYREDLARLIISSLDYNKEGQNPRILLAAMMAGGTTALRYHATLHMRTLLRAGVNFASWATDLLVSQLYDKDKDVAEVALRVLDEACDDLAQLDAVVARKPRMDDVKKAGKLGSSLLIRFLGSPRGVMYLQELDFIKPEMEQWKASGNVEYVQRVESTLDSVLGSGQFVPKAPKEAPLPTHLYGELVKTAQGCALLKESGHVQHLLDTLRGPDSIEQRAAIWALGHIGSCSEGYAMFLEGTSAISSIVRLAERSPRFAQRGAAYYSLCIMSRSEASEAELNALGWAVSQSVAVCSPGPGSLLFTVPPYRYVGSPASQPMVSGEKGKLHGDADSSGRPEIRSVLDKIAALHNHITVDGASRDLKAMHNANPDIFRDPALYWRVHSIIRRYRLRLVVRRFLHDMFADVDLMLTDDFFATAEKSEF